MGLLYSSSSSGVQGRAPVTLLEVSLHLQDVEHSLCDGGRGALHTARLLMLLPRPQAGELTTGEAQGAAALEETQFTLADVAKRTKQMQGHMARSRSHHTEGSW